MARPTLDGAMARVRKDEEVRFAVILAATFGISFGFLLGFLIGQSIGGETQAESA